MYAFSFFVTALLSKFKWYFSALHPNTDNSFAEVFHSLFTLFGYISESVCAGNSLDTTYQDADNDISSSFFQFSSGMLRSHIQLNKEIG